MKEKARKKTSKQIICIIVTIMLCNFIMPNYTYAIETNSGGDIFDPIMKFVTFLCDSLMQFMQNSFTSNASIEQEGTDGKKYYDFQYSPAIIFSGTVMGLDINFIKPNIDVRNTNNFDAFVREKKDEYFDNVTECSAEDYEQTENNIRNYDYKVISSTETTKRRKVGSRIIPATKKIFSTYYYENNDTLYIYSLYYFSSGSDKTYKMSNIEYPLTETFLKEMNATATYTSIANELQPTIATWYNALRRIALVGLLSVLVYLGIRIVLSSSSPEGNSKYKKMLTDWLIALCLLFTLHYIMSATLVITKNLSTIFNTGDTDPLLNTLRAGIESSGTWGEALAQVIMYVVLVIYTVVFTFKYLKRVLYMAFFTMIAPLITLTYPIDKVSDGQAQAFNMWIREYIFNALIQVVHLIVYYTLVGSALDLVTSFPLYAIVAIGFMTQGEAIIRKMFGFNNAETIGTIGAAAAGGLVSSAMNKLKSLPISAKGGGKGSFEGNSNNKVRTATKNPKAGEKGSGGGNTTSSKDTSGNSETSGNSQKTSEGTTKQQRDIKGSGAMAVVGKYYRPVAGTALGLVTGGAGAMIGFAAGVAQGDLGAAFGGAMAGGAAGMNLGKGAANLPRNVINGVKTGWGNVKDTYREGAYGEEAAAAMKFDEEFRKGSTYKALTSHKNFSEESVQAMLDAGITDKKAMTAILDSGMDVEDAIKYYEEAQKCPQEVFYDENQLKIYYEQLRKKDDFFKDQSYEKIRDIMTQFM